MRLKEGHLTGFERSSDCVNSRSACHIAVSQIHTRNELIVEIYIDDDKDLFRALIENKEVIEKKSGVLFDWRELL